MAQVGSFVPAQYACFPMIRQLFARVSMDDSIEANVSTFASEMRETAYILRYCNLSISAASGLVLTIVCRNIDKHSLAIIDELGRGTSTRDGLAIALSIAEALVESKALVWFATHFREIGERVALIDHHGLIFCSTNHERASRRHQFPPSRRYERRKYNDNAVQGQERLREGGTLRSCLGPSR